MKNMSLFRVSRLPRTGSDGVWIACTALALLMSGSDGHAQGCVAVRGGGGCSLNHVHDMLPDIEAGKWQVTASYRWLHSFRHFAGDIENTGRIPADTQVINDSHFFDVGVSYQFTPRFSASVFLPFVYSDRSSKYEHGDAADARHHIQAGGLGDVRVAGYAWVWDPSTMPKGNIQFGLGFKAPTGEYDARDTFRTATGTGEFFVDQSIQPGDGGWGFTTEMFAFRQVIEKLSAYAQAYYLFNPESVNGVSTQHGGGGGGLRPKTLRRMQYDQLNGTPAQQAAATANLARAQALGYANLRSLEDVMSIADQYLVRGGFSYLLWPKYAVALNFGMRMEGIPAEDLLGTSDGFRRPGYTVSVEPGISAMYQRYTLSVSAPVAMYRNRIASEADKRWGQIDGRGTVPGDAAFADYVITASFGFGF